MIPSHKCRFPGCTAAFYLMRSLAAHVYSHVREVELEPFTEIIENNKIDPTSKTQISMKLPPRLKFVCGAASSAPPPPRSSLGAAPVNTAARRVQFANDVDQIFFTISDNEDSIPSLSESLAFAKSRPRSPSSPPKPPLNIVPISISLFRELISIHARIPISVVQQEIAKYGDVPRRHDGGDAHVTIGESGSVLESSTISGERDGGECKCAECGRSFKQTVQLERHIRKHRKRDLEQSMAPEHSSADGPLHHTRKKKLNIIDIDGGDDDDRDGDVAFRSTDAALKPKRPRGRPPLQRDANGVPIHPGGSGKNMSHANVPLAQQQQPRPQAQAQSQPNRRIVQAEGLMTIPLEKKSVLDPAPISGMFSNNLSMFNLTSPFTPTADAGGSSLSNVNMTFSGVSNSGVLTGGFNVGLGGFDTPFLSPLTPGYDGL